MNFLVKKSSWAYLPIIVFAGLSGTLPLLINPGLFWDDWVWIYQSKTAAMQIGRELGIWWAGYLTNFINGLENPVITMRWVSLAAWMVGAASFAYVIYKEKLASPRDCFLVFLLCIATQISPLRFTTSLSMYNVYIASFWLACAILKTDIRPHFKTTLSAIFFLISFYLNSVLAVYVFLILINYLARQNPQFNIEKYWKFYGGALQEKIKSIFKGPGNEAKKPAIKTGDQVFLGDYFLRKFYHLALSFTKNNFVFVLLPIIFILIKYFFTTTSVVYENYNKIHSFNLIWLLVNSLQELFTAIHFLFLYSPVYPRLLILGIFLVCLALLWIIPKSENLSLKKTLSSLSFGIALFMVAVIPYMLVGKPPSIDSLYESRHLMLAIFPLIFVTISALNVAIDILIINGDYKSYARNILVAYLLSVSIGSMFIAGLGLWRDFFTQKSFQYFLKDNEARLRDVSTLIVVDKTENRFYAHRKIWAYEFTGNLVSIYPGKDHLALGFEEYIHAPKRFDFLVNDFYKKRYNFDNYIFSNKQDLITMENGENSYQNLKILNLIKAYYFREEFQEKLQKFVTIKDKKIFIDADQRVVELVKIKQALEVFKAKNGRYPYSGGRDNCLISGENTINCPQPILGEIPELFPTYMKKPKGFSEVNRISPYYLFFSDGSDYKLLYDNVLDIHYAKQAYPDLIDPKRKSAYGFWSQGGSAW